MTVALRAFVIAGLDPAIYPSNEPGYRKVMLSGESYGSFNVE
jgi:hypothetical protein